MATINVREISMTDVKKVVLQDPGMYVHNSYSINILRVAHNNVITVHHGSDTAFHV